MDFFSYYSRLNQHFLPVTAFLQNRGTEKEVAGPDSLALAGQIGSYLGDVGGRASPNDLFVIWIGANDFLPRYFGQDHRERDRGGDRGALESRGQKFCRD